MILQPRFYNWLLLLALCAGLIAIAGISFVDPVKTSKDQIADFSFMTVDGKRHRLYDTENKTVLIHFWASWCLPCEKEFPVLLQIVERNNALALIAVSVDKDLPAMQDFLRRHSMPTGERFLAVWDKDKSITQGIFGISQYPETIIVDRNKTLFKHIVGTADWRHLRFPMAK
jgi:thiol-disulfide isomerase/thioredoxin